MDLTYYTAMIMLAVLSMVVMEICVLSNEMIQLRNKKLFIVLYLLIAIAALCEWSGNYMQGRFYDYRLLHIGVKTTELFIVPFIPICIARIFEKHRSVKLMLGIALVHGVLVLISAFTGFIFYVDETNSYYHGEFYFIYVTVYLMCYALCLYAALGYIAKYQSQGSVFAIAIFVFFLAGMMVTMFVDELKLDFAVLSISAVMLYIVNSETIQQTDGLTHLINRRGYDNYLQHRQDPCVVVFLDVDNFKMVNDVYGHSYGDECLLKISQAILRTFRSRGKCFRVGGDEFAVISKASYEEVKELCEKLDERIHALQKEYEGLPKISCGYAAYNPENGPISDTVKEADEMMYKNKIHHHKGGDFY